MYLPDPTLTFTLPSIHDSTVLDCRIYHPLTPPASTCCPKHAAIIAHPYAPLGGSYDDPIVNEVVAQLLRMGLIVGTFNFRGGGHSAGRTSWTAKAERNDYKSFIGFMIYYTHHLDSSRPPNDAKPPLLLMGGYSYGAMITTQLPPLMNIDQTFGSVTITSDYAHIRHLAETLAAQQRDLLAYAGRKSLRIGEGGSPKSHDSRRSFSLDDAEEKLRRGVHDLLAKTRHPRHASPHGNLPRRVLDSSFKDIHILPPTQNFVLPRPAYLLISPLQGTVTHLVTMSRSPQGTEADIKLRQHPTLAVYGNQDIIVAASKLRSWKTRMEAAEGSTFRGREVDGAGHFWAEKGVLGEMMDLITGFVRDLIDAETQ